MQTVRKYLMYEYVPIMEKTFRNGTRERCVAQRSIYVILRGNEETRSYINQVRIAPRHLFSCQYASIGTNFSSSTHFIIYMLPQIT